MLPSSLSGLFRRKPYVQIVHEGLSSRLVRSLSLWDLVSIGVGGTVGSGIFVLTGLIAHRYSGGAVVYSWFIAGVACLMSALSYAELSSLISLGGSSYVYTYIALGELPAFISACCLSLEYGIAGAAVSCSWSDKLEAFINSLLVTNSTSTPGYEFTMSVTAWGVNINFLAAIMQALVVLLVLGGVDLSKSVINGFTALKVLLVVFIIVAGLCLYSPSHNPNWTPYGVKGVLRGASSCFFGYVGYDEVCCMAGEAKDPRRNVPLGVMYTVAIVTVLYLLAGLALIGMQNYGSINEDTGFSTAFESNHWYFAQHIVAIGEIVTLPIVVLVSFVAQPRVQFALSEDGLLPGIFGEIDAKGNLRKNIIITGIVMVAIAMFVPFKYLDDLISGGVLISFNFTNTSIILAKFDCVLLSTNIASISGVSSVDGVARDGHFIYRYMTIFHVVAFICSVLFVSLSYTQHPLLIAFAVIFSIGTSFLAYSLYKKYKEHCIFKTSFNSSSNKNSNSTLGNDHSLQDSEQATFTIPFFPLTPLTGIVINYYLLGQLSKEGYAAIIVYFLSATVLYFSYGARHRRLFKTNYDPLYTPSSDTSDLNSFEISHISTTMKNPLMKTNTHNNSSTNNSNSGNENANSGNLKLNSHPKKNDYMALSTKSDF